MDILKQKYQRAGKGGDQWAGYGDMASFYRVRATRKNMPILIIPEPAYLPTTKDLVSQPTPILSSLWADAYIFIIFILLLFDSFT